MTDIEITSPYLLIPIKNDAEKHTVELIHDGNRLRYFSAELCNRDDADWIASYSVEAIIGKSCAIRMDRPTRRKSSQTCPMTGRLCSRGKPAISTQSMDASDLTIGPMTSPIYLRFACFWMRPPSRFLPIGVGAGSRGDMFPIRVFLSSFEVAGCAIGSRFVI